MIVASANDLKKNLFDYLDQIKKGEIIIVQHNRQPIAQIVPMPDTDWRKKMKIKPKILVEPEKLIESEEEIWETYV